MPVPQNAAPSCHCVARATCATFPPAGIYACSKLRSALRRRKSAAAAATIFPAFVVFIMADASQGRPVAHVFFRVRVCVSVYGPRCHYGDRGHTRTSLMNTSTHMAPMRVPSCASNNLAQKLKHVLTYALSQLGCCCRCWRNTKKLYRVGVDALALMHAQDVRKSVAAGV